MESGGVYDLNELANDYDVRDYGLATTSHEQVTAICRNLKRSIILFPNKDVIYNYDVVNGLLNEVERTLLMLCLLFLPSIW